MKCILLDYLELFLLVYVVTVKSYLPVPLGGGEILNMGQLS